MNYTVPPINLNNHHLFLSYVLMHMLYSTRQCSD